MNSVMEQQQVSSNNRKTSSEEYCDTSELNAVASKWILDFYFAGICRCFKERNHDAFTDAISTYESISQKPLLIKGSSQEKTRICAFLARIMQGKQLDVQFDEDDDVMPLMSAALSWIYLKDSVEDERLFDNVTLHLIIQSVAVCLEQGQKTQASCALKWFSEHVEYPQKVGAKLASIVAQMDTYHPILTVFSFARLLELVQNFLDTFLAKNPSDFLLKEAIKVVQMSRSTGATDALALGNTSHTSPDTKTKSNLQVAADKKPRLSLRWQTVNELLSSDVSANMDEQSEDVLEDLSTFPENDHSHNDVKPEHSTKSANVSGRRLFTTNSSLLDALPGPAGDRKATTALEDVSLSSDNKANQSEEITTRTKRKLLSPQTIAWEPDTLTKPPLIKPLSKKEEDDCVTRCNKPHRKWTSKLDSRLMQGVQRHGKGKWYRILQDFDFEGRTGVMLKDRWRVLERTHKVD